jgi:hypothetical protein
MRRQEDKHWFSIWKSFKLPELSKDCLRLGVKVCCELHVVRDDETKAGRLHYRLHVSERFGQVSF